MKRDQTLWIVVIIIIVAAVITVVTLASLAFDGTPMWDFDHHMDYPGVWIMGLGMGIPLLAILIAMLIVLRMDYSRDRDYPYDRFQREEWSPPQRREALDALAERYARGEISREEYLQVLEDIKNR